MGQVLRAAALGLALCIAPTSAMAAPMPAADVRAETLLTGALEGDQPTVGVEHGTVTAGRSVAFTGLGFQPGEQVVASFGGGVGASTTLTVGEFGEVAGAIGLPADARPGSHVLRVLSAVSNARAEVTVVVVAPEAISQPAPAVGAGPRWDELAAWAITIGLGVVLVWALILMIVRRHAARRIARPDA